MPVGLTDVLIARRALSWTGSTGPLTSLSDSTPHAQSANLWLPQARISVLDAFDWNFARKRAVLQAITTRPDGLAREWTYAYQLPSDCVRPRNIVRNAPKISYRPIPFEESLSEMNTEETERVLLTDEPNATLTYTFEQTNPVTYTPSFADALILKLATYLGGSIGSSRRIQELEELYMRALSMAKTDEANTGPSHEDSDAPWVAARR